MTTKLHSLAELMVICNDSPYVEQLVKWNDPVFTDVGGQVCRVIEDINTEKFCSLDHIADKPLEFSDPFYAVARLEEELGCPLALTTPSTQL